jgi:hypothetical protein
MSSTYGVLGILKSYVLDMLKKGLNVSLTPFENKV